MNYELLKSQKRKKTIGLAMNHTTRSPRCASMMFAHASAPNRYSYSGVSINSKDEASLSKWLWNNSADLSVQALDTEYIQGMVAGNLHPIIYGSYALQDLVYVSHALSAYEIAKDRASGEVKRFVENRKVSFESYYKDMASKWHVSSTDSITLSSEGQMYVDFEKQVAKEHEPIYFVVAMIPCERLWAWLADQMQNRITPNNVYRFWAEENSNDDGARLLEDFLDKHSHLVDKEVALRLYRTCMEMEIRFFASATDRMQ